MSHGCDVVVSEKVGEEGKEEEDSMKRNEKNCWFINDFIM